MTCSDYHSFYREVLSDSRFCFGDIPPMENNKSLQESRKKPPGMSIVVALLALHGLFLIIIGLIAFFGGFVGVYKVSNGHITSGAVIAVLGVVLAWLLLLEGIVSFLCAQGLWTLQRWAIWLIIALEVTHLLLGGCALKLQLFAQWPIVLSMVLSGGILLYVLIVIGYRMLPQREHLP
jgi:uncharacterized membrane protein (DUF485 family)